MAVFACYKNLSGRPTGLEPAPTPEPQSGALPIKLRSPCDNSSLKIIIKRFFPYLSSGKASFTMTTDNSNNSQN